MITGIYAIKDGRAPHGARGLKLLILPLLGILRMSRPARGAWIEMNGITTSILAPLVAPRTGRVD